MRPRTRSGLHPTRQRGRPAEVALDLALPPLTYGIDAIASSPRLKHAKPAPNKRGSRSRELPLRQPRPRLTLLVGDLGLHLLDQASEATLVDDAAELTLVIGNQAGALGHDVEHTPLSGNLVGQIVDRDGLLAGIRLVLGDGAHQLTTGRFLLAIEGNVVRQRVANVLGV